MLSICYIRTRITASAANKITQYHPDQSEYHKVSEYNMSIHRITQTNQSTLKLCSEWQIDLPILTMADYPTQVGKAPLRRLM
jgi:hypothetical protein